LSVSAATLSENRRKARYGVAYMRSICAQAGVRMSETSPDEDVAAIDCTVDMPAAGVRVQVKCTSRLTITGTSASWTTKPEWLAAWHAARVPVYFVLVIVKDPVADWLDHPVDLTRHHAAAFWRRITLADVGTSIDIPKSQRLTAATMDTWNADLNAVFMPAGKP
jgi:hypothetical protein